MAVFDAPDFREHELVVFGRDADSGLRAIIAVHDTTLGPALGGCRMYPYSDDEKALKDALRLAEGMSYKSALARLPLGGGKSVIIGDPRQEKTPALMRAMGRFIDSLQGRYIAAQDSGMRVEDLKLMAEESRFVTGIDNAVDDHQRLRSGDPSPATAYGVFIGMRASLKHRRGNEDLDGVHVAIQGLGNVGFGIAEHLRKAGARITVADVNADNVNRAVETLGASVCSVEDIHRVDADIFAPCALGGSLNERTIAELNCEIVAGCANNQLERLEDGALLAERGILYAPDFVINAGGIMHVHFMRSGNSWQEAEAHVDHIPDTLGEIYQRADHDNRLTHDVALSLAKERIAEAKNSQPSAHRVAS